LQRWFEAIANWALKECKNVLKIYENTTFHRFPALRVEIIEEKNSLKVIHSQFILPCFSSVTRQFGRTQVVQINI
jgi:hypothetical protein